MSAYVRQDRIDSEIQERDWQDDLILERLAGELLDDPIMLASAIADLDEEAKTTQRLATALHQLYHELDALSPAVMQVRVALYAVIKNHCKEVMVNLHD